jgi:hypothetical protein
MSEGFYEGAQRRSIPTPLIIKPHMTEERIKTTKPTLYKRARVFTSKPLSDNWEDSLIFDARLYKHKIIHIINESGNSLDYQILACVDPNHWHTLLPSVSLAGNSDTYETSSEPWAYYKIRAKNTTAGQTAKITAYISGMTP